eukprot:CAMPEP_0180416432 /NCGR_PEP_ID=MMETSP1036_2-20121128/482_1 /TAXON_ID=632150 /ORGANISM="Azadinium spinosum, Strain 3D9" /LENGTH=113 /DNA_ID=CAMNT_0022421365 /DNA_START=381 /DNA_END=722 /DNA_ORIENTATION=-
MRQLTHCGQPHGLLELDQVDLSANILVEDIEELLYGTLAQTKPHLRNHVRKLLYVNCSAAVPIEPFKQCAQVSIREAPFYETLPRPANEDDPAAILPSVGESIPDNGDRHCHV